MRTIILFIMISINIMAQQFGLSLDGIGMITDGASYIAPVPTGVSVFAGAGIDKFRLEAKVGFQPVMVEYAGLDFTLSINYEIQGRIYVIGSVTRHSNSGSSEEGVLKKRVTLAGAGVGVNIFNFMSFELLYYKPLTREAWLVSHNFDWTKFNTSYLTDVFRAHLKFYLQL